MKQGTRDLVAAAKEAGVRRFVLMSALGTDERSKDLVPYYGAKWDMEQTVKASGLDHVIFRPSFIFGKRGRHPAALHAPGAARARDAGGRGRRAAAAADLGRRRGAVLRAVDRARARRAGARSTSVGRTRSTWNDFLARLRRTLGVRRRPTVHVPMPVMRAGAAVVEWLPNPPVTRDQLTMLEDADNVGDAGARQRDSSASSRSALDEQLRRAAA